MRKPMILAIMALMAGLMALGTVSAEGIPDSVALNDGGDVFVADGYAPTRHVSVIRLPLQIVKAIQDDEEIQAKVGAKILFSQEKKAEGEFHVDTREVGNVIFKAISGTSDFDENGILERITLKFVEPSGEPLVMTITPVEEAGTEPDKWRFRLRDGVNFHQGLTSTIPMEVIVCPSQCHVLPR